ncbi:MAG: carboxy terminal-processing peptidase, partial [Pontibacterium sp.]
MIKNLFSPKALSSVIFCFAANAALAFTHPTLAPQEEHPATMIEVLSYLSGGHFNRIAIDDALSIAAFDDYLDSLDPSRSYFYANDIAKFSVIRDKLDNAVLNADLRIAYAIYDRYIQRASERLSFEIAQLEGGHTYDFTIEEAFETDRENAAWPASKSAADNLWRKRTKNSLLSLKLADKTLDDAKKTVIERYKRQLHRLEQTQSEDVFHTFANAITTQYDPHTAYFSPRLAEKFRIDMSLSLEGIGAVLTSEKEFTKVVRLITAGPAEKTGKLNPADFILGVGQGEDGEIQDVVGWRLDDVVDKIRGPKGSTVRLQVRAADSEDAPVRIVKIVRNKVKLEEQSAQKRIINIERDNQQYKLGVVSIPTFYMDFAAKQRGEEDYKSTTRDVEKLVEELKVEGIDGLIIDLRNNGGGSLPEANDLVGLFIARGPTVQISDAAGHVRVLSDRNPKLAYEGPMIVMVNRLSASASEIFAGAMQDYRRALIVGDQTYGKGSVQALQSLQHGQLKLTTAKFYRISGDSTQNKGVIPDIAFPSIVNKDEIGESALEGALPWDQVGAAAHNKYIYSRQVVPLLTKRFLERSKNDPDILYLEEQKEHLNALRAKTLINLHEEQLKEERSQVDNWVLEAENRRRARKQLEPITQISEIEKSFPKDANGRPINPVDEA